MAIGQVAALIAAVAFALLACVGVYVLLRLVRLISEAAGLVSEFRTRTDLLLERANHAVDRARDQLARTDAITANMDEVSSNMAELTGDISMLTGAVRALLSGPAGKLAAFTFGVRRAVGLRRADRRPGVDGPGLDRGARSQRRLPAEQQRAAEQRLTAELRLPAGDRRRAGRRSVKRGEQDERRALPVAR